MKTKYLAFAMFAVSAAIAGCQVDPPTDSEESYYNAAGGKGGGGGGTTPAADPVITGTTTHVAKNVNYSDLYVMNADGSNLTTIRSIPTSGPSQILSPSWAPTTKELVWLEFNKTITRNNITENIYDIKRGVVTIVSGKPTLGSVSTVRTGISGGDTLVYGVVRWSVVSSPNEIGIMGRQTDFTSTAKYRLWVCSANGGTLTTLQSSTGPAERVQGAFAWSPDGQYIAHPFMTVVNNVPHVAIRVISGSTGEIVSEPIADWVSAEVMGWTRTGENMLLITGSPTNNTPSSGVIDLGSLTYTELWNAPASARSFSPDNSKVLRTAQAGSAAASIIYDRTTLTNDTISTTVAPYDWHR